MECDYGSNKAEMHETFMRQALHVAVDAFGRGEVPVGCIIVWRPSETAPPIIASFGANMVNATRDATRHAELVAIDRLLTNGISSDMLCLPDSALPVACRLDNNKSHKNSHSLTDWERTSSEFKHLVEYDPTTVLSQCDLYVTCEPCIMCAAALARMNIRRVIYGCQNDRFGGCGSLLKLHKGTYDIISGVLEKEAISVLRSFYKRENCHAPEDRRKRKNFGETS